MSTAFPVIPKPGDLPVGTSIKYNILFRFKTVRSLVLGNTSKLFALAYAVINRPRRDYIWAGAAFVLFFAVLLKFLGQAFTETSTAPTRSVSVSPTATIDAVLATTGPASATEPRVAPDPLTLPR